MKVKVAQLCPTLWDPMDYTIHGILRARILEWAALSSPVDLPNPGIEPGCPALQADSLHWTIGEAHYPQDHLQTAPWAGILQAVGTLFWCLPPYRKESGREEEIIVQNTRLLWGVTFAFHFFEGTTPILSLKELIGGAGSHSKPFFTAAKYMLWTSYVM